MAASETTVLPSPPIVRITPPSGWWAIPFGELWEYRELIYFFVWRDIKIRYKQTAIGAAWAVLQPFLTMLIFSLFFGALAHIPSQGLPYPIFYYSALLPWMYFAASLQNATNTIVENQRVITKVYFPRLALPISAVLSGLVDFAISFLMFVAMMAYYHIHPTLAVLWMPVFLLMAVLTALGMGLWLSALNAIYQPQAARDFATTRLIRSDVAGVAGALSYRLEPEIAPGMKQVVVGAELEYLRSFDGLGFSRFNGDALSFGPTFYLHFNDTLFIAGAFSTQIAGRAVGDPNLLDLIHFSRNKAKLTVGIDF